MTHFQVLQHFEKMATYIEAIATLRIVDFPNSQPRQTRSRSFSQVFTNQQFHLTARAIHL